MLFVVHAPGGRYVHTFRLKSQHLLEARRWVGDHDATVRREDAPPRRPAAQAHDATHETPAARVARELADEPVARDAAARDPTHDREHLVVELRVARGHRPEKRFPRDAPFGVMARISTGTGDDGTTGLVGGARVKKTSARIAACGALDEANDTLGLAVAFSTRPTLSEFVKRLQADLFTVGADLAAPEGVKTMRVTPAMIERVVAEEDRLEASLPPLRHFILPGGTPTAAYLQLARSVVRRAEREAWRVAESERVSPDALIYLNRVSDLLFLLAREENVLAGVEERQWMGAGAK